MPFLLDANAFIEAKDGPYGFDFCPAFWTFIDREHAAGKLYSIRPVGEELWKGNDSLAKWAETRKGMFLPLDRAAHEAAKEVVEYVQKNGFPEAAKAEFLRGADPFLIAYAKAHGFVVVTHETRSKGQLSKVKIPNVCDAIQGVKCIRVWDWLRESGAKF